MMKIIYLQDEDRRRERTNRRTEGTSGSFGVSSKGQMFIIASIIILVGLIMLKNIIGIYATVEEQQHQETDIADKQLINIKSEYERILGLATFSPASGLDYLSSFSSLVPGKKLYLYVRINGSAFNVTVGNFLDDKINCTLRATSSSPSEYFIGVLGSKEYATREFQALSNNINLTLSYEQQGSSIIETIPIDVSKDFIIGFFDIAIEKKGMLVRAKEIYKLR
ncbi:MAG: hypothetical protein NT129_02970 [Candidatus Aenigmarchaeota archaeon]|nr:hypothetical protein [Candidatus Aenigmarchaeota archaeon]